MSEQQIIIMEGPDGCGKTNIGKALSKFLMIPYFKVDSEKRNWEQNKFKEALEFDQTYISQFLHQTGYSCVIDRAWPSEFAYSEVYNRETNDHVMWCVDNAFAQLNAIVIVCVRRNYVKVKDDLVETSKLCSIHKKYDDFIRWTACKCFKIYVDDFEENIDLQLHPLTKAISLVTQFDGKIVLTLER